MRTALVRPLLIAAMFGVAPLAAHGYLIETLDVHRDGGRYQVRFTVHLRADVRAVRALVFDYSQWPRIAENLTESRLLAILPDGAMRVRVVFRTCVLFICKNILHVKDIRQIAEGELVTENVSGESDFAVATESWTIVAAGTQTLVAYEAEFKPAFALPPIIGPWVLKRKLRQRLTRTAELLETIAPATALPAS